MNAIYTFANNIAETIREVMTTVVYKPILDEATVRKEKYENKYSEYDYDTMIENVRKARSRCISAREDCITDIILLLVLTIVFMIIYAILHFVWDIGIVNGLEFLAIVVTTEVIFFFIPSIIDNINELDDAHIELRIGEKSLARRDEYNRLTKEK